MVDHPGVGDRFAERLEAVEIDERVHVELAVRHGPLGDDPGVDAADHQLLEEHPGAGIHLALGDTRLLEPQHVLPLDVAVDEHLQEVRPGERKVRRAHTDDAGAPLGVQHPHGPDDEAAPVMADEHRLFETEFVEQANEVAGQLIHAVGRDRFGCGGTAVAALVGRDRPEPGRRDGRELVPPRVGQLGESVGEDDGGPRPLFVDRQLDAAVVGIGEGDDLGLRERHCAI